jgi:PAS domain S-box-containing protein
MRPREPDATHEHQPGRILIVDDEVDFALILADTIAAHGYQVEVTHNASSAREKVETFDAQVALLDVRLGNDNGVDLIAPLKQSRPALLCVMITAYATMDTAIAAIHKGAYDYLQKPLDMRYLFATLDRCFDRLRLESAKAVAEEALQESEERFRSVFENAAIGLYRSTPGGQILMANPALVRMLGYASFEELAQRNLEENGYTAESPRSIFKQRIEDEGQVMGLESAWKRRDGVTLFVRESAKAVRDQTGKTLYYEGTVEDVTQRVHAEAEILRLQRLLQNIANSMPSALIALDSDGQVLLSNPAAETLTGQTAAQIWGRSLWQTCPALARYRDLFEQVLRERQVAHRRRELLTTEGGIVYYDVDIFPLTANALEGGVLHIANTTQRVQLEEMMLQSAKMASLGRLAAGVAHEINNPLGAMMQGAQMVQIFLDTQRPSTHERLRACGVDPAGLESYLQARGMVEYLDGIRVAGGRAAKIVTDLLSFSRKSSSKTAPYDLNTLVNQTLDLASTDYDLKKKYDFRNIEIVRELAPDLPQVICNGQQVQQAILNLIRNAAQALAEKPPATSTGADTQPRLTLRTLRRGEWLRLEVEDNGPGIPPALQARLFEPFFTTKEEGEGTGLGLWLCWSIVVERHKGRIWLDTAPNKDEESRDSGARFVIELPLV